MQVKVCGITQIAQAQALDAMGLNFIGFIFYPASKRYVLTNLTLADIAAFKPSNAKKVGVFVNETIVQVTKTVKEAGLDLVQLHGDESVDYCAALNKLVPVIKVFRVGKALPDYAGYANAATYYLFDTDSALYGGTGQHFNWELIKNENFNLPYFLSGGIGPNDIHGIEVMCKTKAGKNLEVIDINSQFENSPGIKNLEKIKTFIDAIV
ncbi:MAG: phosphoribosylanthranilate isomerase [Bacteroidetes bacterium]|nr:phosphoribosylanthranilate isomerase [Bacteroidota bacterium]